MFVWHVRLFVKDIFFPPKGAGGNLPLPDFTHTIKYALRTGDSITVWNTMIDQAYNFYSAHFLNECDGIAVYQQIGRDMYRKYRSIQREGKNDNLILQVKFTQCFTLGKITTHFI